MLYERPPFPWQRRLAERVCALGWPHTIDLPTASGKTACLDVAVFAMAVRRQGPRRIFFVVDRRVVVDAAFERMKHIAKNLREKPQGLLRLVSERLKEMARSDDPVATYQLRGGIYRDDSWVRSPLQPMLIASTVDQVGSRLLFRGYGVGDCAAPIHAALAGNDSLILLDEAHCSEAFARTLGAVRRYRGREWNEQDLRLPFAFVEMTATPVNDGGDSFELEEEDYHDESLRQRLFASKPVKLMVSKVRPKEHWKLAAELAKEARSLASEPGLRRIAVMVNRVKTARLVSQELAADGRNVHLLIGRMRPVDRMELAPDVRALTSDQQREERAPVFVVATQCLEVGADLDFDAIVTECASIDALVQRFGRLDRTGNLSHSGVTPQGRIVIPAAMTDLKYRDAVYGDALVQTWKWLESGGPVADFGICSVAGDRTVREKLRAEGESAAALRRRSPPAPALLPAHLDALVQTNPQPAFEPEVSLFLHGNEKGSPDVQVVWRADLDPKVPERWSEIVRLCPPVSTEAMTVTLRDVRRWLASAQEEDSVSSDIQGADEEGNDSPPAGDSIRTALRWRGDDSTLVRTPQDVRMIQPGDTLVLPVETAGWNELGHIPKASPKDAAERARWTLRRPWVLRLRPQLIQQWPETPGRAALVDLANDPAAEVMAVIEAIRTYRTELSKDGDHYQWLREMLDHLPRKVRLESYPDERGWVLAAKTVEADSGQDESSSSEPVFLDDHLRDVEQQVGEIAASLVVDKDARESLTRAARVHDWGKADVRFQTLLRGGDAMAAQFAPRLLAKGSVARRDPRRRRAERERSGLPDGFRHELTSLLLAQGFPEVSNDDLALHLIASHHGRCRPFAPVVPDVCGDVVYNGFRVSGEDRSLHAAHRLESGVADRFWRLTRAYGWWGLAYLEAVMRLGDWKASAAEAQAKEDRA